MHMHRSFLLIFKLIKVLVNKYIPSLSNRAIGQKVLLLMPMELAKY